jgi:hypothetical protein
MFEDRQLQTKIYESKKKMLKEKESQIDDSGQSSVINQLEIGSENEIQISEIRRLFKKAVTANKYHSASWVAWAKFEQKVGSPGACFLFFFCYLIAGYLFEF